MATTTTVDILQIQTGDSVKSVAALKQQIKDLKNELLNLDKGTQEYNDTLLKLGNATHDLKEVQEQTAATNNDFGTMVSNSSKALAGMAGAVSAVTGTLSLLGVQVGDDTKLMKTLVSAMAVTQGVQAIDSGIKAVKALGISIKAATTAQKGFNLAAMKNPYILIGAAVLAILTAIIAKIKSQEKAEAEQHAKRIDELNKQLDLQRKIATNAAITQAELAKYANEATRMTEKEIASEKERLKATKEANEAAYNTLKKETEAAKEAMQAQQRHVEQIRMAGVENEAATALLNDRIKTYNDLVKKQNDYANSINDANAKLKILNNTQGVAEKQSKANADATKKEYTEYERMTNAIELANAAGEDEGVILQRKIQLENAHLLTMKEGTEEYDKQAIKIANLNKEYKDYIDRIKQENHEKAVAAIEAKKNAALTDAELKRMAGETVNSKIAGGRALNDTNPIRNTLTFDQLNENAESEKALMQSEYETKLNYLNLTFEATQTALNAELELTTTTAERKAEIQNELLINQAEFNLQSAELEQERASKDYEINKKLNEDKENLFKSYANAYTAISGQITSVLSTVSDSMEQGTKEWKALKTAEAIINTIAGGITGFMSAMELPYPANIIAAPITMAAVLATGFAQVAKIQSTKVSKSGASSTPSTAVVQSIANTPTNVRQTSPQWNDEQYIGEAVADTAKETTVTLVYSDLETMGNNNTNITTANTI